MTANIPQPLQPPGSEKKECPGAATAKAASSGAHIINGSAATTQVPATHVSTADLVPSLSAERLGRYERYELPLCQEKNSQVKNCHVNQP